MTKIPIACTLAADDRPARAEEWRTMLSRATSRVLTEAGAVVAFPRDPTLAGELADLVAREAECCAFFTFTTTVTHDALVLQVDAPPEAWELVTAFAVDA